MHTPRTKFQRTKRVLRIIVAAVIAVLSLQVLIGSAGLMNDAYHGRYGANALTFIVPLPFSALLVLSLRALSSHCGMKLPQWSWLHRKRPGTNPSTEAEV